MTETKTRPEARPEARRDRSEPASLLVVPEGEWSVDESTELYHVERWGNGYFSINPKGHVCVHPNRQRKPAIDLMELIDQLELRGISSPILLRFSAILQDRLKQVHAAFQRAMRDYGYRGRYSSVYPIKVNQQRQVVEEVQRHGEPFGFGLEAGSKAELLAVLALADNDTPVICNGFKDDEYIEMVLLAQKIGRQITPVVERYEELELVLKYAEHHKIRPRIGVRIKLATTGSGRWKDSAGYRSKFGLTVYQAIELVEELCAREMGDCLQLLHFHIGSQITDIRQIKSAVAEAARLYVELSRLGAGLKVLDVGGGLGVDYDGSQTDSESSINYSLQEYANDVVFHVQNVCDDAELAHPTIITECGRAVTAFHSVLVFNVLGVANDGAGEVPESLEGDVEQPLFDLLETHRSLQSDNLLESFHDAQQALDEALNLFRLGYLPLRQRGLAEFLYWSICKRIKQLSVDVEYLPEELEQLDSLVAQTYFCNFSVFQSMPDHWAVDQLFPILPIHRLDEKPTVLGVLADMSCDSDGKVDRFIGLRETQTTLPMHPFKRPYYLGAFLVGAYQEILGDLHNLFGDTNAVHVGLDHDDNVVIEEVVEGDTVREVLAYVQFDADALLRRFRQAVESAVRAGRLDALESGRLLRFYEQGLRGYTYLEEPGEG